MAVSIMGDTGRSPTDSLDDFAGFFFDTALSSSAARPECSSPRGWRPIRGLSRLPVRLIDTR